MTIVRVTTVDQTSLNYQYFHYTGQVTTAWFTSQNCSQCSALVLSSSVIFGPETVNESGMHSFIEKTFRNCAENITIHSIRT